MIARIESHRNRPPLPAVVTLFHRLEAVNAARDMARECGNDQYAAALLAQQDTLIRQFTGTPIATEGER